MSSARFLSRVNIVGLGTGFILVSALSLLRQHANPDVADIPALAVAATILVFLVPSAVMGMIAKHDSVVHGVVLGLLAASFAVLQANRFSSIDWSSMLVYKALGIFAAIAIPVCIVGAFLGENILRRWRVTAN